MAGILAIRGNAFRAGHHLENASIVDVVPTILHLLGLAVPADLDGRVLEEAFTETFRRSRPVRRDGDPDEFAANGRAVETYSAEESEKVAERLRGLGYSE
jgi:arylsulfatase A-like enzyme